MSSEVKDEKEPICTIKKFMNAKGKGIENGGFSYHSIDGEKDSKKEIKYKNGTIIRNGGESLQNGSAKIPNGTVNGIYKNANILNGTVNGSVFKYHGSYDDKKERDEDSVELDFSSSSFMQSDSGAVVECTKNRT